MKKLVFSLVALGAVVCTFMFAQTQQQASIQDPISNGTTVSPYSIQDPISN